MYWLIKKEACFICAVASFANQSSVFILFWRPQLKKNTQKQICFWLLTQSIQRVRTTVTIAADLVKYDVTVFRSVFNGRRFNTVNELNQNTVLMEQRPQLAHYSTELWSPAQNLSPWFGESWYLLHSPASGQQGGAVLQAGLLLHSLQVRFFSTYKNEWRPFPDENKRDFAA